jgi:hypothetical protein
MKDDNLKKFIPQLAIDTEFFHHAFANTYTAQLEWSALPGTAQLAVKGLSQVGDGMIFPKFLRASI